MFARTTSPKRKERRHALIPTLPLLFCIIIEIERLSFIPKILVDLIFSVRRSSVPFRRGLFSRSRIFTRGSGSKGLFRNGEGGEIEILFEVEFVVEDVSDGGSDVVFVLEIEVDQLLNP